MTVVAVRLAGAGVHTLEQENTEERWAVILRLAEAQEAKTLQGKKE